MKPLNIALFLLAYLFALWLMLPETSHRIIKMEDPKYHGADCITTDWKGAQVAYKWDGRKYVKMWRRL